MRHNPKFLTFQDAYLNEKVEYNVIGAALEEKKEDRLYKMFAHVSLTRDPRATRDMVPEEVWANAKPDPEIVALEERRAQLKNGRYRIQGLECEAEVRELTEQIRTKRKQYDEAIVRDYREYYFYNRSTWDIERQLRGEAEEEYAEPEIDLCIPERARLAGLLCHQPKDQSDEELLDFRIEINDLMVALCSKRETVKRNRIRRTYQTAPSMKEESPLPIANTISDPGSDSSFPLLMNPKQCPDCIGDRRLTLEERTFRYCRSTVRNDHFDDRHLEERERAELNGEPIKCYHPKCQDEKFLHLDHFRNHVQTIHGVPLRSSDQVMQRRLRKAKRREMIRESGKTVSIAY